MKYYREPGDSDHSIAILEKHFPRKDGALGLSDQVLQKWEMRLGKLYSYQNMSQLACLFGACACLSSQKSAQVAAKANSLALLHDAKESKKRWDWEYVTM